MSKPFAFHTRCTPSRLRAITRAFISVCTPIFFAATALLACNLPQADFESDLISDSRYETTCAADTDCMVVNGGTREDLCNKACATSWHMAISRSSKDELLGRPHQDHLQGSVEHRVLYRQERDSVLQQIGQMRSQVSTVVTCDGSHLSSNKHLEVMEA